MTATEDFPSVLAQTAASFLIADTEDGYWATGLFCQQKRWSHQGDVGRCGNDSAVRRAAATMTLIAGGEDAALAAGHF